MVGRVVEGAYARLKGLRDTAYALKNGAVAIPRSFGHDYSKILSSLRDQIDDGFIDFDLTRDDILEDGSANFYYYTASTLSKVNQLIAYLESVHQAATRIVQIGSIYNLILDPELKSRCSDLLSANDHFDRVINQATQVLEERIRALLPDLVSVYGLVLFGKAVNSDPTKTRIKFSDIPAEQQGYADLLRGVVGAFRNPSHHRFLANVSREQALQICSFIDNLLAALQLASIENP